MTVLCLESTVAKGSKQVRITYHSHAGHWIKKTKGTTHILRRRSKSLKNKTTRPSTTGRSSRPVFTVETVAPNINLEATITRKELSAAFGGNPPMCCSSWSWKARKPERRDLACSVIGSYGSRSSVPCGCPGSRLSRKKGADRNEPRNQWDL